MEKSMIEHIREFILTCPYLSDGRVNVDYTGISPTEYSIDGTPIQRVVKTYTDGSSVRQFAFVFGSVEQYGSDAVQNMKSNGFYEDFADWLEQQTNANHLPDLGQGKTVWSIEAESTGYLFDADADIARYQIQCKITYFQKGENQ